MTAYYSEFNKRKAQALRNMIAAGLIAPGDVDERDIKDVRADDIRGYTQCHFFAGIGGWSIGLRLAGWPDRRPVWTGSCPCQPFSRVNVHSKRKGRADDRHLLPEWLRLIESCGPATVLGEQVKEAIELGWLDELADGMERIDYAWRALTAPACSVGSPQERERLWIVCDANGERRERLCEPRTDAGTSAAEFPWRETTRTGGAYRGKVWLTQPGLRLLADGLPGDAGILHALGDAINPYVAAGVIGAYLDTEHFRLMAATGVFA